MTENELRQKLVDTAVSYLGYSEANGKHKQIIDIYNSHKPLAVGYKVKYTDAWCSTYASAMAIVAGLTDIIPTECGCGRHVALFQKMDSWVENDAYIPKPGDYVFYDWQDTGVGDNTGAPDHVGIVVSVNGSSIKIIEGNISNTVGYHTIQANARCIRGWGVPNYASKVDGKPQATTTSFKVGDEVNFTGVKHYVSSNSTNGKTCKPGKARITSIASAGKHPYHLVKTSGSTSTVYGWVDAADIKTEEVALVKGTKVRVNNGAKTYTNGSLASYVYGTVYDVIQVNGDRVVIGINGKVTAAIHRKDLTVV